MTKIIINPVAGLANRMRALASGVALAKETNSDYQVIWSVDHGLAARFDDIFLLPDELRGRIVYPSRFSYLVKYQTPSIKNLFISSLSLKRFSRIYIQGRPSFNERFYESKTPFLSVFKQELSTVFIQSYSIFHPYSDDFYRSMFRLNDEIQARVDETKKELGDSYVGLHIRRTDSTLSINHSPDSLFIAEIERILKEDPSTTFYLATDSEPTKLKFQNLFGPDKIIFNQHPASRSTLAGIKDAAAELYLLAGSNRIIGTCYSSYSEAASVIGDIPLIKLSNS